MIAGAGFAMMAWRLAHHHVAYDGRVLWYCNTRECGERPQPNNSISGEFYRILDKAWAARDAWLYSAELCPRISL